MYHFSSKAVSYAFPPLSLHHLQEQVGKKDAFSFSLPQGTQKSGKVRLFCKTHKNVTLELEGTF